MNYLITLRYNGSAYHGWQRQNNADTVQARVEEACKKLFRENISVTGCSRTDTGVHAEDFKVNFHSEKILKHENVVSGLNFFLPSDIAVTESIFVPDEFNARFSCKSKRYIYKIYNGKVRNPFYEGLSLHYKYQLDEKMLDLQAKDYIGTHDFSAFCAAGASVKTKTRTVYDAGVERQGDLVIFYVEADGFLYNMVRIMVGTLIYISEGKIPQETIPQIILSGDRSKAGKTQEPYGLYLSRVYY